MRRQYTGGLSLPLGHRRAQHRADLGLSVMISPYRDIAITAIRAMSCRAGRGHGPRGWRAAGKIPVR
jgi:hypothetical protein